MPSIYPCTCLYRCLHTHLYMPLHVFCAHLHTCLRVYTGIGCIVLAHIVMAYIRASSHASSCSRTRACPYTCSYARPYKCSTSAQKRFAGRASVRADDCIGRSKLKKSNFPLGDVLENVPRGMPRRMPRRMPHARFCAHAYACVDPSRLGTWSFHIYWYMSLHACRLRVYVIAPFAYHYPDMRMDTC